MSTKGSTLLAARRHAVYCARPRDLYLKKKSGIDRGHRLRGRCDASRDEDESYPCARYLTRREYRARHLKSISGTRQLESRSPLALSILLPNQHYNPCCLPARIYRSMAVDEGNGDFFFYRKKASKESLLKGLHTLD